MIKIKKGLDLPISGAPEQNITDGNEVSRVALVGYDYVGMKPTMLVQVGDKVKKGQVLFTDKKTEGVQYTAPVSGEVKEINRGARRVFESLVIEKQGSDEVEFNKYSTEQIANLSAEEVQKQLVESGEWTAIRTRPFSKVPALDSKPSSIFVAAVDTNPLAADPALVIKEQQQAFNDGLAVLSRFSDKLFVTKAAGSNLEAKGAQLVDVDGPHPAGLVGTAIHFLDPVSATKTVWNVGYQDVIAIGKLFTEGKIYSQRVVAVAGPQVEKPRLVRTQMGADLTELLKGELKEGENRVISGSVFGGRTAQDSLAFLGRYANQVSVLLEGRERHMLHYLRAGADRHSVKNIYLSKLLPKRLLDFTTSTNGSERAMVPIGLYEKVMPLDILPTQLLRALIVEDMESAINLGALELDEEDLALCTYVCSGKYEYGPILRGNLERIEKEA
ncbi:Na(+)-translocating NADH-quinone reductase subunit A [Bermanella marisrubri]|uniref:Na(+)-translocating NADH-quinone reductase subunit A n=1 Tax=Bermanella marisrubri TaxID=207949 RepID=Q1N537_9GAMM|nr:Na(+)-translocating NADH-quinone reductase subunit A [Bermanella marisrubri]EAT13241.1 Na(+)-translocating NADH-quinone reductase subunit A [Oceanobacter sp. RED65] [Bermanella marisrubri]QIZ84009.1 Na(+)-translocating NADH-quinone reductase subunit A [Bermanella marisrubri]